MKTSRLDDQTMKDELEKMIADMFGAIKYDEDSEGQSPFDGMWVFDGGKSAIPQETMDKWVSQLNQLINRKVVEARISVANNIYQDFMVQYGDAVSMPDKETMTAWLRSYVIAENIKPEHFEDLQTTSEADNG